MCLCDLSSVTSLNSNSTIMIHVRISLFLILLLASACATTAEKELVESIPIATAERISKIPDFARYSDVKEKKKAFFDFLRPMVKEENERLLTDRRRMTDLFADKKANGEISVNDQSWLKEKASKFRMKDFDDKKKTDQIDLLSRVDIIPEALFLAQSANESAWGTSRFARKANNLFGQWCFTKGCGLVPEQRGAKETHEVQKFKTINDAVASYVHNLNSHPAYKKLRDERKFMRNAGKTPTGYALAIGLEKYSTRGEEYVKEIRSMISINKLEVISD